MIARFIPYLRLAPYAAIALFALFAALQWQNARHWQKHYVGEAKAHSATIAAYTTAQRVAAELNKAKVERIRREYAVIAEKSERNYDALLADNRRNLSVWMRGQAVKGSAISAGTGQAANVSGDAMSGAAQAQFLVSGTDLEIAADNYSQLLALIEWAKAVGNVPIE